MEDTRIAYIRNEDLENVLKANLAMAVAIIKVLNKRLMDAQQQVKTWLFITVMDVPLKCW